MKWRNKLWQQLVLINFIIQESFNEAGYLLLSNLSEAIIDFTDYGVPQKRKRIIIFGVRKDTFGDRSGDSINYFYKVALPKHKTAQKKTVLEAIGDLPKLYPLVRGYEGKWCQNKAFSSGI